MYHRAFREIDLSAIEHNFNELSKRINPQAKKCAVIKADAYGHGAAEVAKLLENKVDYFAVAAAEEAFELREKGINAPVLILAYTHPDLYGELIEKDITATVYSCEDACLLNDKAKALGKKAKVHIAVDTGMSRIGFDTSENSAEEIRKITELPHIFTEGIFSHYAKADFKDKTHAKEQTKLFDAFIDKLSLKGVDIPVKHLFNSAAILAFENKYDMVRMGVALYGINPFEEEEADIELIPAMTVKTHIIHLHTVEKGTGVGYGHLYVAKEKRTIATLSIGYADGFNRVLSGKGYVLIKGKKAPIAGKVCMDIVMVDVTDIENLKVGDEAVIIGKSGEYEISADDFGKMCGSFAYEALSTFMPRVKKIQVKR